MKSVQQRKNNHRILLSAISSCLLLFVTILLLGFNILWSSTKSSQALKFGITYHTELRFDSENNTFQKNEIIKDLETIQDLGVDLIRTDVSWQRVSLDKASAYEFDSWLIDQVQTRGMKIMWVIKTPEQITLYSTLFDLVDYLQVTNEPNSVVFSEALGSNNPASIVQKLISNFRLVNDYSPNTVTVLNPVDMPEIPGLVTNSWIDLYKQLQSNEIVPSILGVDSYPGGPYQWGYPLEISRTVAITRENLSDGEFAGRPIWIIETGSPSYQRTMSSQQMYIRDVMKAVTSSGANGLIVYEAFDNPETASEVTDFNTASSLIESNFGIFDENRIPKPAALEYERLIRTYRKGMPYNEISLSQSLYILISAIFRLIIPAGGPVTLAELAAAPNILFISLGFVFRCALAVGIESKVKNFPWIDISLAISILIVVSLFQQWSGTQTLLWQLRLAYLLLFFLFLWSGTTQIVIVARRQITKSTHYLYPFFPSLIGFALSTITGFPGILWFFIAFLETLILVFSIMYRSKGLWRNHAA